MRRGFPDLLDDYTLILNDHEIDEGASIVDLGVLQSASDRLHKTLPKKRADLTPVKDHERNAKSWAAAVEDATTQLHNLIVIHDNGGTSASTARIKDAGRELVRLLGVE